MTALLDANALIALGWPAHEHHPRMLGWFKKHAREGWATTAFTQAALVRVVCQPSFSGHALGVSEVAALLARNTAQPEHRLLTLDFGFEAVVAACTGGLLGHRQVTDGYLLTAAIRHRAKLVTFDRGIGALLATAEERQRHLVHP